MIQIIKYPNGGNPSNAFPMMGSSNAQNRPYIIIGAGGSAGAWTWSINNWNGGGGDYVTNAKGNNVVSPVHVADGNIHCLLMHWGDQASQGLIFDIDGYPLIPDNSSFTVTDNANDWSFGAQVMIFLDRISGINAKFTNNNTVHRYGLAWAPTASRNTITHAQSRALAQKMMAAYGVTDLTP